MRRDVAGSDVGEPVRVGRPAGRKGGLTFGINHANVLAIDADEPGAGGAETATGENVASCDEERLSVGGPVDPVESDQVRCAEVGLQAGDRVDEDERRLLIVANDDGDVQTVGRGRKVDDVGRREEFGEVAVAFGLHEGLVAVIERDTDDGRLADGDGENGKRIRSFSPPLPNGPVATVSV